VLYPTLHAYNYVLNHVLPVLTNKKFTEDDSTIASEKQYIVQQVTIAQQLSERIMIHMQGTQVYVFIHIVI